jgi:hypothetical protein
MGRLAKARSGRGLRSRSGKQSAECGRDARRGSEVDLVDMVNVVVGGDAAEAVQQEAFSGSGSHSYGYSAPR